MVTSDPVQFVLIHTPTKAASLLSRGTLDFEWTVVALFGACTIAQSPIGVIPQLNGSCSFSRQGDLVISTPTAFFSTGCMHLRMLADQREALPSL